MSSYPPPVPGQPKKGLSGWAIAGIGCLVIVILGFVGAIFAGKWVWDKVQQIAQESGVSLEDIQSNPDMAKAKIFAAMHPDIEMVSEDAQAGTMTIKVKSSGETMTVTYKDLSEGKLVMTNSKGEEVTIDGKDAAGKGSVVMKSKEGTTVIGGDASSVPPPAWVPMHASLKPMTGGMRSETNDGVKGTFMAEATGSSAEIKDYYEKELKAKGYEVQTTVSNAGGVETAMVSGDSSDKKNKLVVMVNSEGGKVTVMLNYEGPK